MRNTEVLFRDGNTEKKGIVLDKIKVLQVGGNASYDNYLIAEKETCKVFIVNPFSIVKFIRNSKLHCECLIEEIRRSIINP